MNLLDDEIMTLVKKLVKEAIEREYDPNEDYGPPYSYYENIPTKELLYLSWAIGEVKVFMFDNGPDYVSDGMYRIIENGKMGFANEKGKVVIPPKYDFVWPFEKGSAKFCNGCTFKKEGEHTRIVEDNAVTGFINRAGKEISKK